MTTKNKYKVSVDSLYNHCDLSQLSFNTTTDLTGGHEYLGQNRAIEALKFCIGMKYDGYNLYVLGSSGLGKNTAVKKILEKESATAETPGDLCYINNFKEAHKPLVLKLPAGYGQKLRQNMLKLIDDILVSIPGEFESDEYITRSQAIHDVLSKKEVTAFEEISEEAAKKNIVLSRTADSYTLESKKDGKILSPEEFELLDEKLRKKYNKLIDEVETKVIEIYQKILVWQKEDREQIKILDRELSERVIAQFVTELNATYSELPEVLNFIYTIKRDIIEHANDFRYYSIEKEQGSANRDTLLSAFSKYHVNVLVDNSKTIGAPVIYEANPSYLNLIGRIEHVSQLGTLLTDFTLIKAGALHRANGGYLVLDARKVLMSNFSWEGLKRVIHAHEVRIESLEQEISLASTTSLQPESIPIDVKVILTGSRLLYYFLKQYDPEFGLLFKVAADFAEDIERNNENSELYAKMIALMQSENNLTPINKKAVQRIIEHCSRLLEDSEKISLHKGSLLDLLREGAYWAKQVKGKEITEVDIQKAIDTRQNRLDQTRERMHEEVIRGNYLLDTDGEKVAQINALSVLQFGDFSFGQPCRITATARLGQGKIIDIEREVKLGGSIHSKGVMILSAYLANRYAKEQPMSLSASLVFEQSYGLVEGDSASAAELCALLSAISDIPIKQNFSVTGSVNQYGEIQAIGGVNEKVEGFYDVCNARGLTGQQAVIIPKSNIKHLMLRADVRKSIKKKLFAIYAVETIDQMMELLTGKKAGNLDKNNFYPKETINNILQERFNNLNILHKHFSDKDLKE